MGTKWGELFGDKARVAVAIGWATALAAGWLAYYPGLAGPFLLDDLGSIKALGDYGGVVDWETFKLFVLGGGAGPTGRPLALLSFLVDGNNWPTDARPFKRTNVIIHLANGVLLGVLVRQVLKCLKIRETDVRWIALVTAAAWMLHPFLVSTTLYVVQRMAQLSTTFMFAGLALYLHGRSLLVVNTRKAYVTMSIAITVFTFLAMISKENGILLPVLVGVIELTVVASQGQQLRTLNRYWVWLFILVPTIVIGLYLGERLLRDNFLQIVPPRDFSVYERFLTQGRVLMEYLQHWLFPKLYTTGVFQDHFLKSTGLFAPPTTALSFLFHGAVIILAFVKRRQLPLFSLAVLFFYASHLLESTVINLELYFEHRNYGATAFLLLPLIELGYRRLNSRSFAIAAVFFLLLLASFTRFSATVWQSLPSMIETSALKAPTSARAQSQYAKLLFLLGDHDKAVETIDRAIENIPEDDPLLLTNRMYFLCSDNRLKLGDFEAMAAKLSRLPLDSRSLKAYNEFSQQILEGNCPNIPPGRLEETFLNMLNVPANSDPESLQYSHVNFLIGFTRLYLDKPQAALQAFERSLDSRPGPSHAMSMAAMMASHNYSREALVLADRALAQLRKEVAEDPRLVHKVKESDILAFQATVSAELAGKQGADTSDRDP
jgi:tetratricopeptide (TPR) repeat protein